jgi:hypothetical protein
MMMHIKVKVFIDVMLLTCSSADVYLSIKSYGVMSQNTTILTAKLTGNHTFITKFI